MKYLIKITSLLFIYLPIAVFSKPLSLPNKDLLNPPPRIIRTCCSFGSDLNVMALPIKKITNISSLEKIGAHHYLGDKAEGNGIIYTRNGGFIDMGHLRDQADWTAFLYSRISKIENNGYLNLDLGHEGGIKQLHVKIPENMSLSDKVSLAGKIAYDLSVWHEIATWFGTSTVPFITEKYSSFSIEDVYSNMMGVNLGMLALKSELPYEKAMTQLINQTLHNLKAVKTEPETYAAMEAVRDLWWTREKALPSKKILLERQLKAYPVAQPWLVPGWNNEQSKVNELTIPENTIAGLPLTNYYQLRFSLNYKFPFRKMFPARTERFVTQNDFDVLLAQVALELQKSNFQYQ